MKMVDHALAFASQGTYVFPCNEPVFRDKVLVGCTCEPYRHTLKCKENHPRLYLQPGEKCANPGKCPRVRWGEKSTIDPETIRQWWTWWPTANIGIDVGKSGLLVLDRDKYKPEYEELDLSLADTQTITVISGGGGEQLWYKMGDAQYTNSPKGLPTGNDIRGKGGYIVAPPSLHKSGRRYTFEDGYGVGEVDTLSIPQALRKILDVGNRTMRTPGTQVVNSPVDVTRAQRLAERVFDALGVSHYGAQQWGDGIKFILSTCPYNPADDPHAEDRSAFVTIAADGALSAGCHHNRCQHVIADSNLSGWHLLKQMAGIEPKEKEPDAFHNLLAAARHFGRTTSFAAFIPASFQAHIYHKNEDGSRGELLRVDYRTDSTDTKVYDALLDMAALAHNFTIYCSLETGRDIAGVGSKATFRAAIERLIAAGLIERNNTAQASDLAQTYRICIDFVLRRLNASNNNKDICVQSTQYETRKATDPFLSGRSQHAKRNRLTEAGLGEGFLRIMDVLSDGQGWERLELAEETGKKAGGLGRLLKRGEDLGLLESLRETPRSPKVYYLSPDCWAKVEELAPTLKTYHLRAERAERELEHEQDRAEVREKMASLPDTIAHYARRKAEIILARRHYLAMIHPDWSAEMVDTWLKTPKPTATPRLDAMDKQLAAESAQWAKQGIVGDQAIAYATIAGYSKREATRLGELTVAYQEGPYASRTQTAKRY